eukprot:1159584-Pelagomonas_calceolata.AAC.5
MTTLCVNCCSTALTLVAGRRLGEPAPHAGYSGYNSQQLQRGFALNLSEKLPLCRVCVCCVGWWHKSGSGKPALLSFPIFKV